MRVFMKLPETPPLLSVLAGVSLTVATALGLVGCGRTPAPRPGSTADPGRRAETLHDHAHVDHDHAPGPHGGTLADWGGGVYHVEFTVDHEATEAVIHVLGADERTPAPVQASGRKLLLTIREPAFQVELFARPLEGESEDVASRYVGTHQSLGIVREFAGTISGQVDGTPYAGDFMEHAHAHETIGNP